MCPSAALLLRLNAPLPRLRDRAGLLGNRGYAALWLAHTGSTLGDGLYAVTLVWLLVTTLRGGPAELTFLGLAQTVPLLALGILGGVIADRADQKRLMIASDLARAAAVGGLAILVLLGLASVPTVLLCAVTLSCAGLLSGPARQAVLPAVVPADRMASANALFSLSTQSSALLAPAAAGALFGLLRPEGLLFVDALTFLWSAALLSRLDLAGPTRARVPRSLSAEARDGLRFIKTQPRLRSLVLIGALNQLLAAGPFGVAVPLWMASRPAGVIEYGFLMSTLAAGILLGSLVVGVIGIRRRLAEVVAFGVLADGVFFALAALSPHIALSALCFGALGFSFAVLGAALKAELQRTVPRHLLGRTFATFGVLVNVSTPVSLTITGLLLQGRDPAGIITGSGLALASVGVVGLLVLRDRGGESGLLTPASAQSEEALETSGPRGAGAWTKEGSALNV